MTCDMSHVICVLGCFIYFLKAFFLHFSTFKKSIMKNVHSNPRIRSCAILQWLRLFFSFLINHSVLVHFLKEKNIWLLYSMVNRKLAIKKPKWPSKSSLRYFNYTNFLIDRKCRKLWQPAPSLCPPPLLSKIQLPGFHDLGVKVFWRYFPTGSIN